MASDVIQDLLRKLKKYLKSRVGDFYAPNWFDHSDPFIASNSLNIRPIKGNKN